MRIEVDMMADHSKKKTNKKDKQTKIPKTEEIKLIFLKLSDIFSLSINS